jgi:hypothetical protein
VTDNDNWQFQVSPKLPDGTLVNVRGATADEFFANIEAAVNIAPSIAALGAALTGTGNLAAAGVTGQPVQSVAQVAQQAVAAQPASVTPINQGGPPAPVCKHGQMTFRDGQGKRGYWSAHFCPTAKGTPDQCEPVWGN